jgi:hypothetical protein
VKYRGLLNKVKKLRAQLAPSAGVRIVITGGLPPDYKPEPAPPPGSDLHAQAPRLCRRTASPSPTEASGCIRGRSGGSAPKRAPRAS